MKLLLHEKEKHVNLNALTMVWIRMMRVPKSQRRKATYQFHLHRLPLVKIYAKFSVKVLQQLVYASSVSFVLVGRVGFVNIADQGGKLTENSPTGQSRSTPLQFHRNFKTPTPTHGILQVGDQSPVSSIIGELL